MYLTGATLFLSLILSRVFYIILDFIHVQENYTTLQAKVAKQSGNSGEAEELRKRIRELEAESRDFGPWTRPPTGSMLIADNLKKQASQQNTEYNRLADEHNKAVSRVAGTAGEV